MTDPTLFPAVDQGDALRWAVVAAEADEDRAWRWIGFGKASERATEKARHAEALARAEALRTLCEQLGHQQPPLPYRGHRDQ